MKCIEKDDIKTNSVQIFGSWSDHFLRTAINFRSSMKLTSKWELFRRFLKVSSRSLLSHILHISYNSLKTSLVWERGDYLIYFWFQSLIIKIFSNFLFLISSLTHHHHHHVKQSQQFDVYRSLFRCAPLQQLPNKKPAKRDRQSTLCFAEKQKQETFYWPEIFHFGRSLDPLQTFNSEYFLN